MNRAVADKRRSGNEESRGAVMSGAERVEPEVSPTPAKPRNNNTRRCTHTHSLTLCACKLFYSLTEKHWNLNNPRSWKQTLWILKDFDAFIKDWLSFEFIWIVLYDVHETSNMLWILMAQWAVCDKWWNIFECCAVLGWLLGAFSLWLFTVLWKLAKPGRYQQPGKLCL